MTTETQLHIAVTPETHAMFVALADDLRLGDDETLYRLLDAWRRNEDGALAIVQREVSELRDELHELAVAFRRHQAKALLRDVDDASEPSLR